MTTAIQQAHKEASTQIEVLLAEQSALVIPYLKKKFGDELATQQIELESKGVRDGIEQYYKHLESSMSRGDASSSAPFTNVVGHACEKLAESLAEYVESRSKRRNKHVTYGLLKDVEDFHKIAHVAVSVVIDQYAALVIGAGKVYPIQMAINDIGRAVEDEIRFGMIRDNEAAQYSKVIKPKVERRVGKTFKKALMSKIEDNLIGRQLLQEWDMWTNVEASNVGLLILDILTDTLHMFREELTYRIDGKANSTIKHMVLQDAWHDVLINASINNSMMANMRQPCVIPPKAWHCPIGGGYYMKGKKPLTFVRTRNRKALERMFDVRMPDVYEAVNIIQKTPWKVNTQVLQVAQAMYALEHTSLASMPQREPLDEIAKLEGEYTEEELKDRNKIASDRRRMENVRMVRRAAINRVIGNASEMNQYKEIYFPYNADWRGRINAVPAFNPQGSEMTKGLLTFAEGEAIGEEGIKWLAIHGASRAGLDKETLEDAEKWTYDNELLILNIASNPLDNDYWQTTDEPFQFLAFCFEWAAMKAEGVTFKSTLPISFDGSCSGIQHFSCMLRDEVGGAAVNLIPSERMNDIYGMVADTVNKTLLTIAVEGSVTTREDTTDKKGNPYIKTTYGSKVMAQAWIDHGVDRETSKQPTMTLPYGSEVYGFTDQILDGTVRPSIDAGNGLMFIDIDNQLPRQSSRFLAEQMWSALRTTVTKSVEAMGWLQHVAGLMSAEVKDKKTKEVIRGRMPIFWTTSDGFPVWHEYRKDQMTTIDCVLYSGKRHQVSAIPTGVWELDAGKQRSGISPNFVHSLDATHLRKTVVHARRKYGIKSFQVIHDSFGTTAAQAGNLFRAVREMMIDTYKDNDVLEDFREQFIGQLHESQLKDLKPIPEKGTLDLDGIMDSWGCFR